MQRMYEMCANRILFMSEIYAINVCETFVAANYACTVWKCMKHIPAANHGRMKFVPARLCMYETCACRLQYACICPLHTKHVLNMCPPHTMHVWNICHMCVWNTCCCKLCKYETCALCELCVYGTFFRCKLCVYETCACWEIFMSDTCVCWLLWCVKHVPAAYYACMNIYPLHTTHVWNMRPAGYCPWNGK